MWMLVSGCNLYILKTLTRTKTLEYMYEITWCLICVAKQLQGLQKCDLWIVGPKNERESKALARNQPSGFSKMEDDTQ